MNLVIVESPGKVATIEKYLGKGWKVLASVGHVRDLPEKALGITPPEFKPMYVETERGYQVLDKLRSLVNKASNIYLATDQDREGEAIAWHLKEALKLKNYKRITFGEISKSAILKAIENPRDLNYQLVAAQEARRVADRLVGFMVSPELSKLIGEPLSAGRVQSPLVLIIVLRERAIREFKPTNYFGVKLKFTHPSNPKLEWFATWNTKPILKKLNTEYITDLDLALKAMAVKNLIIKDFKEETSKKTPNAPFITSTLQQEASKKLKLSLKKTMELAQKLYEAGLITYMRTDSPNLSDDAITQIQDYCRNNENFSTEIENTPRRWPSKENAQEAHECIRPSHFDITSTDLGEKENKLYQLIWLRTIASQLKPAIYAVRKAYLISKDNEQYQFNAEARVLTYLGWMKVYQETTNDELEKEDFNNPIPKLLTGSEVTIKNNELLKKVTKPPVRYKEDTIIKELERLGIGRPSTYATIFDNVLTKQYIKYSDNYLIPTPKGELVVDSLIQAKFSFIDLNFTKKLETTLDNIATNKNTYLNVISKLYQFLTNEIDNLKKSNIKPRFSCPNCSSGLIKKKGKDGTFFWGCSGYPDCKTTLEDVNGKPTKRQEYPCPSCQKPMYRRKGKENTFFWGCSGYPDCKTTLKDVNGKPNKETKT